MASHRTESFATYVASKSLQVSRNIRDLTPWFRMNDRRAGSIR